MDDAGDRGGVVIADGSVEVAIRAGIDRLARDVACERLRLYRLELQATITTASTLLLDVAGVAGQSVGDLGAALPVPWCWGGPRGGPRLGSLLSRSWIAARLARSGYRVLGSYQCPLTAGILRHGFLLRHFGDPGGGLGFMVRLGGLECVAELGSALLHVGQASAVLYLNEDLPATIRAALPGRRLSELVDHAVLRGRDYRVRSVGDGPKGGTAVGFRVPVERIELPWAEGLRRELEASW